MEKQLSVNSVNVEPLTSEAFEPFGDVIEAKGNAVRINQGRCQKFPHLTKIQIDDDGYVGIHIYHTSAVAMPFTLDLLERHPLGSQSFMPLEKQPFLVVVAEDSSEGVSEERDGDRPDLTTLRCFITNGEQGVTYHPGVWHHPLLSVGQGRSFMVVDRNGPGHNCDEVPFAKDVVYTVEVSL
ncbi:ureidoglycolate lyase [Endozoicomonas ascidiicola]|uniref:ureidoglycolate lyase n=1 Tax=Endozoicomonas ascidiicola TaxID=1698521 RepID=UPI00082ED6FB|nr:ureidoglycolate lyase [Endozoicomonas ascidiicola]